MANTYDFNALPLDMPLRHRLSPRKWHLQGQASMGPATGPIHTGNGKIAATAAAATTTATCQEAPDQFPFPAKPQYLGRKLYREDIIGSLRGALSKHHNFQLCCAYKQGHLLGCRHGGIPPQSFQRRSLTSYPRPAETTQPNSRLNFAPVRPSLRTLTGKSLNIWS